RGRKIETPSPALGGGVLCPRRRARGVRLSLNRHRAPRRHRVRPVRAHNRHRGPYQEKRIYYNYHTTTRVRTRRRGNGGSRSMEVRFREPLQIEVSCTLKKILGSYVPVNVCHYL